MKKKISKGKVMTIGAGVAALGAGAYYLLGPNARAHQKKVLAMHKKGFVLATKVKKELLSEYKKAKVFKGELKGLVKKVTKKTPAKKKRA